MIGVEHTLGQIPPRLRRRAEATPGAVRAALRRIGELTERGMNRNLSGGGTPGAYPVPRRSGHLARSGGMQLGDRAVVIFNTAQYAGAVHDGFRAFGNPNAPFYPARPFLVDAAMQVDPAAELIDTLERIP